MKYSPSVKLIRLRCTGRVDPKHILFAMNNGADGVMVAGCLEGGCHFLEGNLRARRRVERVKKFLDEIGIGGDRLEMFNLSSAEGPRFAQIVKEMAERIAKIGLSPFHPSDEIIEKGIEEINQRSELAIQGAEK